MRFKILLLALSLAFSGLLVEGVLRVFYEPPPTWIEPQPPYLDSPLLDWVLPSYSDSYSIDAPVRTNRYGLRDDDFPAAKPEGETRILALGDSFTFALGVRFEDLWVQQFETRLNESHGPRRFQVINGGMSGYNTRQELIYLLYEGLSFEPDMIVVGFYWNDLLGNAKELPDLEKTPRVSTNERRNSVPGHWLPKPVREILRRSLTLYLTVARAKALWNLLSPPEGSIQEVQNAILSGDTAVLRPYWSETKIRLLEIAEAGRERGIPTVLMAFPMENQIVSPSANVVFVSELREIWNSTGFPLVDVEPAYVESRARGENPFLPYYLHPNAQGMKIASDLLYETILDHGLLGLDRDMSKTSALRLGTGR